MEHDIGNFITSRSPKSQQCSCLLAVAVLVAAFKFDTKFRNRPPMFDHESKVSLVYVSARILWYSRVHASYPPGCWSCCRHLLPPLQYAAGEHWLLTDRRLSKASSIASLLGSCHLYCCRKANMGCCVSTQGVSGVF
jgi:hypothetical protein